jgi:two-component system, NtrC family, nitrogen regulation sensor histidine kinase NtrY
MSSSVEINKKYENKILLINGDDDQLYRVFINLIKNSEEAFIDKTTKKPDFKGKINIEITSNNDYIVINLIDNGTGISDTQKAMTPYFTTKKTGTGLGLPIVNKIINEHHGEFIIKNIKNNEGLIIEITFPKINE